MKRRKLLRAKLAAGIMTSIMLLTAIFGTATARNSGARQEGESPNSDYGAALSSASDWLISTHQNQDGGYTSFSLGADTSPSDVGGTVDALLALLPAGSEFEPPLNYLRENIEQSAQYAATDGSTVGKLILALVSAGENPREFSGQNFVLTLTEHLSPTGQYGVNSAFNQSLAILGSVAADEPVPDIAIDWLLGLQAKEGELAGSWDDGYGTAGNADSTAVAMIALANSDHQSAENAITGAKTFLNQSQLDSGGWEYGPGYGENANTTAMVLQALVELGEDFSSPESPWANGGITPLSALLAWQGEEGAFQADFGEGRFEDFFSTVQAMPALASLPEMSVQVFAPALAAETSADAEPATGPDSSAQDGQGSSEEEQGTIADESGESDGGLSICPAAFAMPLLIGLAWIGTNRRRE
jgi:hypothetical protein